MGGRGPSASSAASTGITNALSSKGLGNICRETVCGVVGTGAGWLAEQGCPVIGPGGFLECFGKHELRAEDYEDVQRDGMVGATSTRQLLSPAVCGAVLCYPSGLPPLRYRTNDCSVETSLFRRADGLRRLDRRDRLARFKRAQAQVEFLPGATGLG